MWCQHSSDKVYEHGYGEHVLEHEDEHVPFLHPAIDAPTTLTHRHLGV